MRKDRNVVWEKMREIQKGKVQEYENGEERMGLSFAAMARMLNSAGYTVTSGFLCDGINGKLGKRLPEVTLLSACWELWKYSPDQMLFGAEIEIIQKFLCCYNTVIQNQNRYEKFIEECTALADEVPRNITDNEVDDYDSDDCGDNSSLYLYFRRFEEVRRYSGKTAGDIARLMGCHRSTIFQNEKKRKRSLPNMRYLFNFCNSLDVSADYILHGEFLALPWDISTIVYGLTYGQQIKLLEQFISISENLE